MSLVGAVSAALLLAGCSYSTESSFLGYRTSTSFSTPGAAPASGYYPAPTPSNSSPPPSAAPAPTYTEAPPPPPPPAYYPVYGPPVYYGPVIGIGIGRSWRWGRRRW